MAAICRGSLAGAKNAFKLKTVSCLSACLNQKVGTIQCKRHNTTHQYALKSSNSRRKYAYLQEMYERRMEVGPDKERHPSAYGCWNHDAEIYAFGERFGETFDDKLLRRAFIQSSFVEEDLEKQRDLGLDMQTDIEDNFELAQKGQLLASRYIKAFLRHTYPQLYEEGICAIHDYLMSEEMLYNVASDLGLRELIQSAEYPPEEHNYVTTFMAVVGVLLESQDAHTAEMFVLDFIIPQLVGKDVNEIWNINNPMGLLAAMFKESGRGEPEARLLWASAKNTVMPLYFVGIYSDKQLLGKSPGESAVIAEDMAARESVKLLLNMADSRAPLVFGDKVRDLTLDYDTENRSITQLVAS